MSLTELFFTLRICRKLLIISIYQVSSMLVTSCMVEETVIILKALVLNMLILILFLKIMIKGKLVLNGYLKSKSNLIIMREHHILLTLDSLKRPIVKTIGQEE